MFKSTWKPVPISLTWIPVYITVTNHVLFVGKIKGRSMEPTLQDQDWVVIWKWNCHQLSNYKVKDIIFFKSPMNPKVVFCKRVKGLQYDSIMTKSVGNETSTTSLTTPVQRNLVHVPRNHIWCEGDNVFHSIDSNTFGPISTGLCVGKVNRIIWPPSRWGTNLNEYDGRGDVRFKR